MKIYETSDMGVITLLDYLDFQIQSFEEKGGGKVVFYFEDNKRIPEIVIQFWSRKIHVEPQRFLAHLRNIKIMINQLKNGK